MSLKFPKLKTTNCIVAFLSSALQAFGMYNIHALSGVTEGGVLGATLLFDHWFGLSPAVSSFVLNIACYVLGWRTLGKSFIAYSAIAACGYSASYAICDSPRPMKLRQKASTGQWFLWEYSSIFSGIRIPAAQDPWA